MTPPENPRIAELRRELETRGVILPATRMGAMQLYRHEEARRVLIERGYDRQRRWA